ncbi:MAG: hypothetical protein ACM3ST_12550 [Bdellovibrio bacteriovorus]
MSIERAILTLAAAMTLSLSSAIWAQTPEDQAAAVEGEVRVEGAEADRLIREAAAAEAEAAEADQLAQSAREYSRMKMDEATNADDRFHANRTEANMVARDKAEAEAAEAIKEAHATQDKAIAAKDRARAARDRANAAMGSQPESGQPR